MRFRIVSTAHGGRLVMQRCAGHAWQLVSSDIGKIPEFKSVLKACVQLGVIINGCAIFWTAYSGAGGKALRSGAETRFLTFMNLAVHVHVEKEVIKSVFNSDKLDTEINALGTNERDEKIKAKYEWLRDVVLNRAFWRDLELLATVVTPPIAKAMRICDSALPNLTKAAAAYLHTVEELKTDKKLEVRADIHAKVLTILADREKDCVSEAARAASLVDVECATNPFFSVCEPQKGACAQQARFLRTLACVLLGFSSVFCVCAFSFVHFPPRSYGLQFTAQDAGANCSRRRAAA